MELLRDHYVWAYERSTQEYVAIKREFAEPDPMRFAWRELIKQTVSNLVLQPEANVLDLILDEIKQAVPEDQRINVQALIVEKLKRLHEGVLARYFLRPSSCCKTSSSPQISRASCAT